MSVNDIISARSRREASSLNEEVDEGLKERMELRKGSIKSIKANNRDAKDSPVLKPAVKSENKRLIKQVVTGKRYNEEVDEGKAESAIMRHKQWQKKTGQITGDDIHNSHANAEYHADRAPHTKHGDAFYDKKQKEIRDYTSSMKLRDNPEKDKASVKSVSRHYRKTNEEEAAQWLADNGYEVDEESIEALLNDWAMEEEELTEGGGSRRTKKYRQSMTYLANRMDKMGYKYAGQTAGDGSAPRFVKKDAKNEEVDESSHSTVYADDGKRATDYLTCRSKKGHETRHFGGDKPDDEGKKHEVFVKKSGYAYPGKSVYHGDDKATAKSVARHYAKNEEVDEGGGSRASKAYRQEVGAHVNMERNVEKKGDHVYNIGRTDAGYAGDSGTKWNRVEDRPKEHYADRRGNLTNENGRKLPSKSKASEVSKKVTSKTGRKFTPTREEASSWLESHGYEVDEESIDLLIRDWTLAEEYVNEDDDDDSIVEILRDHYQDETNDSAEYAKLAKIYPEFAKFFNEMSADEAKHARYCKQMMNKGIEMSEEEE